MKNACTRKVLISTEMTRAVTTMTGSSRKNERRRLAGLGITVVG